MSTLTELAYYCEEKEPVGALMLTGEWGCGKTYLIEHDLQEKLKDSYIIVRVSLFGVDSIESLNKAVKSSWVESCSAWADKLENSKVAGGIKQAFSFGSTIANVFLPYIKSIADAAISINPLDFIQIKNEVKKGDVQKKVILVFDDLERSKLDTVDVLGCINEYCENQGFNTIIIANEDKITDSENTNFDDNAETVKQSEKKSNRQISYSEIKEKIVSRTILYRPDYSSIIHSLLENRTWIAPEYKKFLNENESLILDVFETDTGNTEKDKEDTNRKGKPHNIRSLKCALQDFHRVYELLEKNGLNNKEKFLYSFIAYTIADKAGIAKEGHYGYIFSDEEVIKLYPYFDTKYLLSGIRDWIKKNVWNENTIEAQLEEIKRSFAVKEPKDILRVNRVFEIDDQLLKEGFPGLLQDCYDGKLSPNDYVLFIENSCWCRHHKIPLPNVIDWERVMEGIQISLQISIEQNDNKRFSLYNIGDSDRHLFSEQELQSYDLIAKFRKDEVVVFENNKKMYLDTLESDGIGAFSICKLKRYRCFDNEMASATVQSFLDSSPYDKSYYPTAFKGMWEQYIRNNSDSDLESTKQGFEFFIEKVRGLEEQLKNKGESIAAIHAEDLIAVTKDLIEKTDQELKEKSSRS